MSGTPNLVAELASWGERVGLSPAELITWRHVLDHAPEDGTRGGAYYLKAASRAERARPVLAGELVCPPGLDGKPGSPLLWMFADRNGVTQLPLLGRPGEAERLGAYLESNVPRGAHICHWDAAENQFHTLLRWVAPRLAADGWVVLPYATGSRIVGVNLRRGKCSVLLTDALYQTGESTPSVGAWRERLGLGGYSAGLEVAQLRECVEGWQARALRVTGASLRVSIGAMALALARCYLPSDFRWFRTPRLVEAVCRAGGAYRGGYCYAERHAGPAWKVDMVRAYTWALASPLPSRSALAGPGHDPENVPGLHLCRVEGHGNAPAYLAAWDSDQARFRKKLRQVGPLLCWLVDSEVRGLRALEYQVSSVLAVRFTQHVDLALLARHLGALHRVYGRGSVESTLARNLANNLAGKLGQPAERTQVCYARERPDPSWYPYTDTRNQIVHGVWCQPQTHRDGTQHVEAAASITARVRGRVYSFLADWGHLGGRFVHADTDGLLLTSDPTGLMPLGDQAPGDWRLDGYDPDARVYRAKWYRFNGRAWAPGVPHATGADLELVASGGKLSISRRVLAPPWEAGARATL